MNRTRHETGYHGPAKKDGRRVALGGDLIMPIVGSGHQTYKLVATIEHTGPYVNSGHWRAHLLSNGVFYMTSDTDLTRSQMKDVEASTGFIYMKIDMSSRADVGADDSQSTNARTGSATASGASAANTSSSQASMPNTRAHASTSRPSEGQ